MQHSSMTSPMSIGGSTDSKSSKSGVVPSDRSVTRLPTMAPKRFKSALLCLKSRIHTLHLRPLRGPWRRDHTLHVPTAAQGGDRALAPRLRASHDRSHDRLTDGLLPTACHRGAGASPIVPPSP